MLTLLLQTELLIFHPQIPSICLYGVSIKTWGYHILISCLNQRPKRCLKFCKVKAFQRVSVNTFLLQDLATGYMNTTLILTGLGTHTTIMKQHKVFLVRKVWSSLQCLNLPQDLPHGQRCSVHAREAMWNRIETTWCSQRESKSWEALSPWLPLKWQESWLKITNATVNSGNDNGRYLCCMRKSPLNVSRTFIFPSGGKKTNFGALLQDPSVFIMKLFTGFWSL